MRFTSYLAVLCLFSVLAKAEGGAPAAAGAAPAQAQPGILTPASGPAPRINGPRIFGARPGAPFLYTIPATGDRPMKFAADGLPVGLKLDETNGQITGSVGTAGNYAVTLRASNAAGKNEKTFRIVIGDKIALTPPMGWNSWNCWGDSVSGQKILSSAQALVKTGLNNHGWTYINIDDGWQGPRGGSRNAIQPNPKFPDIKALADQLHGLGLKFGIYSTPWIMSYAGYVGSSSINADGVSEWIAKGDHDESFRLLKNVDTYDKWHDKRAAYWKMGTHSFAVQDAAEWAEWGVDYLKYDWHTNDVGSTKTMADALRQSGRDIVLSLSNSAPIAQAADWQRLTNAWRTTGDIVDTWDSMSHIGFSQEKWAKFGGPGHWNDPDMLVVGQVGWGKPHPTRLTHNEQYAHISLWCLLSAPLLIGADLAVADDFTISLLSNDEVLEIDQDSLGKEATPILQDKDVAIYAKPLDDGSWAVGLFNRSPASRAIGLKWDALKLSGSQRVRDLWRQKDEGVFSDGYSAEIPCHGVRLIRIFPSS